MGNFEPGKQDVKVILDPGKLFLKRFPISWILTFIVIKVPKYLEWVFECSKKHSEEKTSSKKRSTN